MKNIVFIAPPSAGKGTQSELLTEKYGYVHISTGDLLRKEAQSGSDLGKKIQEIMNSGGLVDDSFINSLLKNEFLKLNDNQLFILDGYPRNTSQAEGFDRLIKELNITDYMVIYLNITKEEAMARALGRVTCESCGQIYNIYYDKMKPKVEGICDICKGRVITRSDDNEQAFLTRFDTYIENTIPVLDYFKNIGKLVTVDVKSEKHETFAEVEKVLND